MKNSSTTATLNANLFLSRIKAKASYFYQAGKFEAEEHLKFIDLLHDELMLDEAFSDGKFTRTSGRLYFRFDSLSLIILRLRKDEDRFEVKAFHQLTLKSAEDLAASVLMDVERVINRVHQLVQLSELNATRMADPLLILEDVEDGVSAADGSAKKAPPPPLACPVQFSTTFKLNHRLKTVETRLALQSSVLHPFAVSNRLKFFVYKDEVGKVFYLELEEGDGETSDCKAREEDAAACERREQGSDDASSEDNTIRLKVYGVDSPGPSITSQLTSILKNRISTLALDALSTILRNNPRFMIEENDMRFLMSFQPSSRPNVVKKSFNLPAIVQDPYLFLLFLRQNVSGSGFFHLLNADVGAQHLLGWGDIWRMSQGMDDGEFEEERDNEVSARKAKKRATLPSRRPPFSDLTSNPFALR